ncbi:hypothetical protein C8R46DRAFT_1089695 [Mycena filopes]|nr:hypothetical protein C8R46DRAFT_1089695 [Mycena filopes]
MPLVLAESSSCDVCLDGYTPDEGPHAIPCGHIFCRTCLLNVEPTNCPLCRKAFNRDRIKKLHVDSPETDVERDFLRRFALAFEGDQSTGIQFSLELEAWLAPRSEDDHLTLRRALTAFRVYNRLKSGALSLSSESVSQESESARDTFKAIEASLLTQVSELTACIPLLLLCSSSDAPQIADLEAQVFPLRSELAKYQYTTNPLPAPPEPPPSPRRATPAYFTPAGAPGLFPVDPPVENGKGKGKQRQQMYELPAGNLIIPGATPSQRVIPIDDVNGHAYHTHAPASAFVDGYGSGFGLGYGTANAGLPPDANYASTSNHPSTSSYQYVRPTDRDDPLETAMGGLQLWGMPSASEAAVAPVVTPLSNPTATLTNGHAPTPWQPPPSIYAPSSDAPVRFNTEDNPPLTAHESIARRAVRERNRQSYSSMSDLGLANFPQPGGRRNSVSSTDGGWPRSRPAEPAYDANAALQRSTRVNNRQRTVPRRFSQLPTGASEFGLGLEAAVPVGHGQITAPTPRVGMTSFLRSFSHSDSSV